MKSKLVKSIVLLSLTLMLFISTLYAWYISNTTVSADNISGSVMEAEGGGLEIIGSSLTDDSNLIYPYKPITFKMRANKNISKIIIDFDVTSSSEDEYKALYKNNPQYTYGKYTYVKNKHSYNYEVEDENRIDMLWNLSLNNDIDDFFSGNLTYSETTYSLKQEDDLKYFECKIDTGSDFTMSLMLGREENTYPSLDFSDYKIEASNFNCFMLGMKIKLIFTVEEA